MPWAAQSVVLSMWSHPSLLHWVHAEGQHSNEHRIHTCAVGHSKRGLNVLDL